MAMVAMMKKGYLKHVISQNIDGLHRKSGIAAQAISELHGNTNLEICEKCDKDYMRDYKVRTSNKCHDHKTGRECDNHLCRGDLYDSIINFNEFLKEDILYGAYVQRDKCDLMLSLGSSLRIHPACGIPEDIGLDKKKKHVIVNLQKTPLDDDADFVIHGLADDVIERLMKKLKLGIPEFRIDRWVKVQIEENKKEKQETLHVSGIDKSGGPFDLFRYVKIDGALGGHQALREE